MPYPPEFVLSNLKVLAFAPEGALGMSLRIALAPPHELVLRQLPDPTDPLTESADVLILAWDPEHSARIGALATTWRTAHNGPVFALCSGGVEQDVAALLAGADQILHPPVQGLDIQARLMAHLRLTYAIRKLTPATATNGEASLPAAGAQENGTQVVDAGLPAPEETAAPVKTSGPASPIRIDDASHRVFIHGNEVTLTPKEYELLHFLTNHEGKALTRDDLLDQVWGINFDTGTNMVDVYVHFLRKKLRKAGLPKVLETVRGRGYRLNTAKGTPLEGSPSTLPAQKDG
ncbi:MAG: winged-helix domain-containing protein [Rhodothermales bacterium]|nr:winged-helix domain-containing protein [Rhodothermales bacterium]